LRMALKFAFLQFPQYLHLERLTVPSALFHFHLPLLFAGVNLYQDETIHSAIGIRHSAIISAHLRPRLDAKGGLLTRLLWMVYCTVYENEH
ncbi:MAG: hypothetical protein V2A34_14125, partial [Lentisphaerota bacterium]